MQFTENEIERAKQINLEEFLRYNGEVLKKAGSEWKWMRHDSVNVRGNRWFQHSTKNGGSPIGFLKTFYNMSFEEAVCTLLNHNFATYIQSEEKVKEKKDMILPKSYINMRRVYAYLMKIRHIDGDVITHFAKAKKIYEEEEYHNVVFVGLDEKGVPKSASKRSTLSGEKRYRGNVVDSDNRYTFNHIGISERVYVFESAIDMLSYICLHKTNWQEHSYITLNGVAEKSLLFFLTRNSQIKTVVLALDNDEAGIEAMKRISIELKKRGYEVQFELSNKKDWNEDLVLKKVEVENEIQMGCLV